MYRTLELQSFLELYVLELIHKSSGLKQRIPQESYRKRIIYIFYLGI